eukprot:1458357-Rhodomonas_salina.1
MAVRLSQVAITCVPSPGNPLPPLHKGARRGQTAAEAAEGEEEEGEEDREREACEEHECAACVGAWRMFADNCARHNGGESFGRNFAV